MKRIVLVGSVCLAVLVGVLLIGSGLADRDAVKTLGTQAAWGASVNGLQLTLSAKKPGTVMKADGSDVEPIDLLVTFKNVGKKPLRVDAFLPWARHFVVEVAEPHGRPATRFPQGLRRTVRSPSVDEYPELGPGESYHASGQIGTTLSTYSRFPYSFSKPGKYRVRLRYVNPAVEGVEDHEHLVKQGKNWWTGEVTSNEIVLTVLPGGQAN